MHADTTAAATLARRIAALSGDLSARLPAHLASEDAHRLERALREAAHHLGVAATAAGLVRAGGDDAR